MSKQKEYLALAMKWFATLTDDQKLELAENLLERFIDMDYIHVFDEETARECAEESGKPIAEYLAPYWESCGEPIIETGE